MAYAIVRPAVVVGRVAKIAPTESGRVRVSIAPTDGGQWINFSLAEEEVPSAGDWLLLAVIPAVFRRDDQLHHYLKVVEWRSITEHRAKELAPQLFGVGLPSLEELGI